MSGGNAVIFSGQGAQVAGMGEDFYENSSEIQAMYKTAEAISEMPLRKISFGLDSRLNQTEFAQPALLIHGLAVWSFLSKIIDDPIAVGGLSLGEITAIGASEALSFEKIVRLICHRARSMRDSLHAHSGKMVALITEDIGYINNLCEKINHLLGSGSLAIANHNAKNQYVLGGIPEAISLVKSDMKENAKGTCIELAVEGAFHTSMMSSAAIEMKRYLQTVNFDTFRFPVINNADSQVLNQQSIVSALSNQIDHATDLVKNVQTFEAMGATVIYEVGPRASLKRCINSINPELNYKHIGTVEDLESVV